MPEGRQRGKKSSNVMSSKHLRMSNQMQLTPQERLLVALTQRPDVREGPPDASAVLAEPGLRRSFLQLARDLGVEGLALKGLRDALLPEQARQEFGERLEHLRRQAMVWDLEQERVLHLMSRRGITPMLLKGSALRHGIYNESVERSMGDLDLLVERESIESSMTALQDGGYVPETRISAHPFHHHLEHPRGFIVELHWGVSDASSFVLDEKLFLARATVDGVNHANLRVPSREDLLLHLVSQNEDDAFGLLRRIVDVDRIVAGSPSLDWTYVERSAHAAGLDVALAVSIRLAQLLLRTEAPTPVAHGLRLPILSRINLAMLQPVRRVLSSPSARRQADTEAFRFWCAGTWRGRTRRLRAALNSPGQGGDSTFRAGSGIARLTKLGLYQALVYAQSGAALLSAGGRRRLRFW